MVTGVMNWLAAGVMTTRTSAPSFFSSRTSSAALKAAIPPVIPSKIRFPLNVI